MQSAVVERVQAGSCGALQQQALAEDEPPAEGTEGAAKPGFSYHALDPDIITNYLSDSKTLGYIRVTVELMIEDKAYLSSIEHHEPLILDIIISTFNKQPEDKIKSLTGREEIRLAILDKLQQAMKKETGNAMIKDILFTKYLYQ